MKTRGFRLSINEEIVRDFPEYRALAIYAEGLSDSQKQRERSVAILREAEEFARSEFSFAARSEHPHIAAWRAAFKRFGVKPSKAISGTEALLKRVLSGHSLPILPTSVNLYNAVSLEYLVPVGGEDWDTITSDLELRYAIGNESFVTMSGGEKIVEHPSRGEPVWIDSTGVTCRRWNWRQCSRTAITEGTVAGYFVLDALPPFQKDELNYAAKRMIEHLQDVMSSVEVTMEELT